MNQTKIEKMNSLPTETQNDIKQTLRAYHSVNVTFANGKYSVDTGICVRSKYAEDFEVIGEFKDTDIYTLEERRQNFREEFNCDPTFYVK